MTSISYEDVFSYFLGNITDYQIAELDAGNANEVMKEYLQKTLADPKIYTYSLLSLVRKRASTLRWIIKLMKL